MSGKPYTMKEMKMIVEYLTEHSAFGEVKGRKMWMDFSNTNLVQRTWQSLKETFLKRILPDIHNPYYKLTMDEIRSFRQGVDVTKKQKDKPHRSNKKEAFDSQEPSTSKKCAEEATAGLDSQEPSTSKKFAEDEFSGEDSTCKKISPHHRSSVETVILEHTYENAEEIVRVLESSAEDETKERPSDKKQLSQKKSLRDRITYTEPLTPMLLEVLHDFATDDEDDGKEKMLQNQITPEKNIRENDFNNSRAVDTVNRDIKNVSENVSQQNEQNLITLKKDKISSIKSKNKDKSSLKLKSKDLKDSSDNDLNKSDDAKDIIKSKKRRVSDNVFIDSQKYFKCSSDSCLPNNQEAFQNTNIVSENKQVQSSLDMPEMNGGKKNTPNKHVKTKNTDVKKRGLRRNKEKSPMSQSSESSNKKDNFVGNVSVLNSNKFIMSSSAKSSEIKDQKVGNISISDQITKKIENYVTNINGQKNDKASYDNAKNINNNYDTGDDNFDTLHKASDVKNKKKDQNNKLNNAHDDNSDTAYEVSNVEHKKKDQDTKSDIQDDNSDTLFEASNAKTKEKDQAFKNNVQNDNLLHCVKNQKTENKLTNQHNSDITNIDLENIENNIDEPTKGITSPSVVNPCLKSISLYAEQFSLKKYSDTEGSCHENPITIKNVQENAKSGVKCVPNKEVTVLNSNSDSGSSHIAAPTISKNILTKLKKIRALDNLFGFSSGGVVINRKRSRGRTSNQPLQNSAALETSDETSRSDSDFLSPPSKSLKKYNRKSINISSETSDSTSESDSEYVSPPRKSRKKSKEKKKVKTNHILERNGAVFVANDKKVYPIVRQGITGPKHITCWSERLRDEELYWKSKYVQERKKTSELTNVLNQASEKRKSEEKFKVPAVSAATSQDLRIEDEHQLNNSNVVSVNSAGNSVGKNESNKIKLKLAKKDYAVELEGHWPDIKQVFNQVMQVLYSDKVEKEPNPDPCIELSSGKTTPLISPDLREAKDKVNQIENEIFKEIIEKDKEDTSKDENDITDTSKDVIDKEVTSKAENGIKDISKDVIDKEDTSKNDNDITDISKDVIDKQYTFKNENDITDDSKGVIDKEHTSKNENNITDTSKDLNKTSLEQVDENKENPENKIINKEEEIKIVENVTVRKTRGRTKKNASPVLPTPEKLQKSDVENGDKNLLAIPSTSGVSTKRKRSPKTTESVKNDEDRKTRNSKAKKIEVESKKADEEDSEIRYKFPSPAPEGKTEESPLHSKDNLKEKELSKRYKQNAAKMFSPPDILSTTTIESTQGYQDSDISITRLDLKKRKRRNSLTLFSRERNRIQRRKRTCSNPILTSDESYINNSKHNTVLTYTAPSSSLNSEIYRSESFQLLMSNRRGFSKRLEKINETQFSQNVDEITEKNGDSLLPNIQNEVYIDSSQGSNKDAPNTSQGNSSIISLPLSPEISIVENLTVNKSALSSAEDLPNNNNTRTDNFVDTTYNNKHLLPLVDVSMPLVTQESGIKKRLRSKSATNVSSSLTNISLDKNILLKDSRNTVSESFIDKIGSVNIQESQNMSESLDSKLKQLMLESAKKTTKLVEMSDKEGKENSKTLKSKARKRCSTPHKRQSLRKSQCPKVDTVIEERMETCSLNGRKSCPPSTTFFNSSRNANKKSPNAKASNKTKSKNKKNVIKVKITRPQSKTPQKTIKDNKSTDNNQSERELSKTQSDKNDTESGIFLQAFNDTVELTHNHSETCLRANDYIEDSVEFIENSASSIISLNSSTNSKSHSSEKPYSQSILPDLFCTNACDLTNLRNGKEGNALESEAGTSHNTPLPDIASLTSLLTEDLSNEEPIPLQPAASDWYLFSTEESYNAHDKKKSKDASSYGAKLEHIFPEICTVPNLSTITEMSRETDQNSRKKFVTDN